MRKQLAHLPKPVAKAINAFRRRQRFYEFLRAVVAPLVCYAALAPVAMHLDRFLFLSLTARLWISGITHGVGLAVLAVSLALFFWRRRPVSRIAYDMENELPASVEERLVTLNDILSRPADTRAADPKVHAAMVDQLTSETLALCQGTPHPGRLAHDRILRRSLVSLVVLGVIWAGFAVLPNYQFGLMWKRLTFPMMNLPKPSFVRLIVTPEAPTVPRRGEVVLQVQVQGSIPVWLRKPMSWLGADSSVCLMAKATGRVDRLAFSAEARPMSRVQSRMFVASMTDLQESFSYRVRCGDAETDIRFVKVVPQPRIVNASLQVEPPAYTGLKTAVYTDLRDPVSAFATSRMQLRFSSDQAPLKSARLVLPQTGATLTELKPDPKTGAYLYNFTMSGATELEIVLVNEVGFENDERVTLTIALREDQPPVIRIEYPVGDVTAAQGELIPMHMELSDDLGLQEASIRYQISSDRNSGDSMREFPLQLGTNALTQTLSAEFDLEKAGAVSGDEVLLMVSARDTGRNDANSQPIRIRVAALAGNENEHRRIIALRLISQTVAALTVSADRSAVWAPNEEAFERIANDAKNRDLVLDATPSLDNLLAFMEREHHFTDSAASAADMRMLRGVVAAMADPPASLRGAPDFSPEARKALLQQLTNSLLPGLRIERTGRDIARRALNLRGEVEAMMATADTPKRANAAGFERRVNLLMDALDGTSEEFIKLSSMTPLVKKDEILACSQKISRAGRDFKQSSGATRQEAAETLCEQIDAWIGLLLPALPELNVQHRAARAALRTQFSRVHKAVSEAAQKSNDAGAVRWMIADARMIERSPYAGLGERLASVSTGAVETAAAPLTAAFAGEAALFERLAMEDEYTDWLDSPRMKQAERRMAEALRALDLATDDAARASAADRLRTLRIRDADPTGTESARPAPARFGLYDFLPALTDAATSLPEPHGKAVERLMSTAVRIRETIQGAAGEAGSVSPEQVLSVLNNVQSGLASLESDAARVLFRMHLDVAYNDPQREGAVRLATTLPSLRDVFGRYQAVVPPLIERLRAGAGRRGERETTVATVNAEGLAQSVTAMNNGLGRVVKQLKGETPPVDESYAVREMRFYLNSARRLAGAKDPAEVARAFFAAQPAAAAIVLDRQVPALAGMRANIRKATEALKTQPPDSPAFRDPMRQAAQAVGAFEQTLLRFASLDPQGTVRALAGTIRKRTESLSTSSGDKNLSQIKYAMDELQRQAQDFEISAQELVAQNTPASPAGWRGGPSGIWDGAARRDAERARRRVIAQFERARRDAALGFDAILSRKSERGLALPDQPLAGSLFAWRAMQSSLGGAGVADRVVTNIVEKNPLEEWLKKELEENRKALRILSKHTYPEPTDRWIDSFLGILRRGSDRDRKGQDR